MPNNNIPVITIDGPAGAGKGTLAKRLAAKLGWHMLDSGAMYRLLALHALRENVAWDNEPELTSLAQSLPAEFVVTNDAPCILLAGEDVSQAIRTQQCSDGASIVAAIQPVRQALLQRQRDFQTSPGLVADGRDMGTVVFPQAVKKFYITASAEERAKRRFFELQEEDDGVTLAQLLEEVKARDERDTNRKNAPLIPADDAMVIDTSDLNADAVFEMVMAVVEFS